MSTVIRMFASVRIKEANCERRFSNVSNFTPTLMKLGYNFRLKIRFSRTPSRHPDHFKSGSHISLIDGQRMSKFCSFKLNIRTAD